ncbi:autophagy protein 7 [Tieghemostelium lacteum]|uniref:Ubiquitin-like modifier-activating enzyme ATG7 n=1 Tax=Tieghemostelium lacteum TaxID=361077 RepID=A0A152A2X0_TIELA|nr:autophagy protein 7 [Tieghemostelium lacteum]|eukprot:KYR00447.1 autophagy protein 7 [Tieghemostelium lacteum]
METLKFKEFSSLVNISFWHELSKKKLDVLKLSDKPVDINAYYTFSTSQQLDPFLCLEFNSFQPLKNSNNTNEEYYQLPIRSYLSPGTLYNYNTSEDFKQSPKAKIFEDTSKQIYNDITTGKVDKDPSLLTRFILLTYADIKNHQFYYLFGFPALLPSTPMQQSGKVQGLSEYLNTDQLKSLASQLPLSQFFLLKKQGDGVQVHTIDQWTTVNGDKPSEEEDNLPIVGFCDPCCLPENPSWPLRNFLVYLSVRYQVKKVKVICFRGMGLLSSAQSTETSSIVFTAVLPEQQKSDEWSGKSVGWEKDTNGKIAPRYVSIASTMDPLKLASQSVDLNLKLMRWRILPSLNLEKVQDTKCLLLGSGTLGCNVARCLMSWGVRNLTFVDSGKVSYSNPVRQTLFTFDDCTPKQKEKATAAADAIKKIFPAMNAKGEVMSIPMAGHAVAQQDLENVKSQFEKLDKLVQEHDVIYLLTDSRESRWLPTLLARYYGKLLINAALGFDSYLVIRHGVKGTESDGGCDLGCYFCNDVIAPSDTMKDRTLDQQCTVTRPGLSMMASAAAVELMVSVLHHPQGGRAPGETQNELNSEISTPLGIVPHQLRGFLSYYQTLPLFANPYKNCTACSQPVINEFKEHGWEFVLRVLNDSSCLTKITGIDDIQNENVNIDWEIEGQSNSDDGDDF